MTNFKTIGIVSPSAPIAGFCPKRLQKGIKELESLGYQVKTGDNVSKITGHSAGSIQDRVHDIHQMFQDNEVEIIIATIGGYNANDLLEHLDYELIKKNNSKLFIGYSDITVLLHTLHEKSHVQTILGPMILPQFGEFGGTLDFTKKHFQEVLQKLGSNEKHILPISKEWTEELTLWDKEDNRLRVKEINEGIKVIQEGVGNGKLMGGNLRTLLTLAGTRYFPSLKNSILFLEDDNEESIGTITRMIRQLDHLGVLSKVNGIVFGRFQKESDISPDDIKQLLLSTQIKPNIPILFGLDFGHTDPMLSLPIGKEAHIDTKTKEITVTL